MIGIPGLLPGKALRRIFGVSAPMIERRSVNLPVQVERRRGPRCENCGVGTLNPVPAGHRNPGSLQCDHPGCGDIKARQTDAMECVIRSS